MTELVSCLPEHARRHFIDRRNIRQEKRIDEHQEEIRKLRGQMAARGSVNSSARVIEERRLHERLSNDLAVGFVEDALATCRLYDIPLTHELSDSFLGATKNFLEIEFKHASEATTRGFANAGLAVLAQQQSANMFALRRFRVIPEVSAMIETARVEDERRRVKEHSMTRTQKRRFSPGRRVLVGIASQPGTVVTVDDQPSTHGEFQHTVTLDQNGQTIPVLGSEIQGLPELDEDLRRGQSPSIHLHIENSSVANLNLGAQVGTINAALEAISGDSGAAQQELVLALKQLTEATVAGKALPDSEKQEIVQALSTLALEAAKKPEERARGPIRAVISWLPTAIAAAADLSTLWERFGPAIKAYFGI